MQEKYVTQGRKLLREHIKKHYKTANEFVVKNEFHYKQMWSWVTGTQRPNLDTAFRIEDISKGEVKARSWTLEEETDKPKKPKAKNKTS